MGLRETRTRPRTRGAPPPHPRSDRSGSGAPPEANQIAELERILSGPQHFQLQFFGEVDDARPQIRRQTNVWAADAAAAANLAAAFPWPDGALRLRIVDAAGRVVFKRLRPKRS